MVPTLNFEKIMKDLAKMLLLMCVIMFSMGEEERLIKWSLT